MRDEGKKDDGVSQATMAQLHGVHVVWCDGDRQAGLCDQR